MAQQSVAPATGPIPQQGSAPLSQNPDTIVRIPYQGSSGPQRMDIRIGADGNVGGYASSAYAIVEHYDPFANAIVRDQFLIGGRYGADVISIAIGESAPGVPFFGEVRVAIFNTQPGNITGGSIPVPPFVSSLLSSLGFYDKLTQTNTANASFHVTDMGGGEIRATDIPYFTSLARITQRQIVQQFDGPSPCFAASTPISMADGSKKPIEEIKVGDLVLAFDSRSALGRDKLIACKVVRLIENITDEWMLLSFPDDLLKQTSTVVTPSHRFLSADVRITVTVH